MGNQAYNEYVSRLKREHGDKFNDSALAPQFAEHFGQRVEVKYSYGETKRGWITGTTGWCPSLMILLRRTSRGSSWLVGKEDKLVRVVNYESIK